ncbi:MAG: HAMP domain-containing protein [Hyphomicrobiaceae bacterium]|nr:MAG: HAMP domain-containing protein [Hyphomicrobiaceae bacterium]
MTMAAHAPLGRSRSIPIATLFSLILALMVLLTVGSMLAAAVVVGQRNLFRQLGSRFDLTIRVAADRVGDHLKPAQHELRSLAALLARQPELLSDPKRLADVLGAAMSASPQIVATALVRPDQSSMRLERGNERAFIDDLRDRTDLAAALKRAESHGPNGNPLGWSDPLFGDIIRLPVIAYLEPVWSNGSFRGVLVAVVSIIELSHFMSELSTDLGETLYILWGTTHVLAHPRLPGLKLDLSSSRPLPTTAEIGDDALARMVGEFRREVGFQAYLKHARGHVFESGGVRQVHVFAELRDYGRQPWLLGFHAPIRDADEVSRWQRMVAVGLAFLALSIVLALIIGRGLARPIRRLAAAANEVKRLDFASVQPLERSRIREMDDAALSFNTMTRGLRLFETYVPRRLVSRLMEQDGNGGDLTRERDLTVMFTDLVGFSTLAERTSARETAELLNQHFELVVGCIRATDGTVDKYLGDGVMAFWGAPRRQEDHAQRACRAAIAMAAAIKDDNLARARRGASPLRVRISLHSGPVIVGNIGASARINYTIVGDTVNVAARILEIGREQRPEHALILVSGETLAAAGAGFTGEFLGHRAVKGRRSEVDIHRLVMEAGRVPEPGISIPPAGSSKARPARSDA